jgi:CO/xanthine dehydrogenase Mo-binding subunit
MPGQVSVGMMLRDDGKVNILAQANDIGVSGPTAYVQVVADELGFSYSDVTMRHDKNVCSLLRNPEASWRAKNLSRHDPGSQKSEENYPRARS